jgi:predicted metal-dependent phosphoesterase TrpH
VLTFEIHCHTTRYSECSVMSPPALVRRALEIGLDGVCITEHDTAWSDAELEGLRSLVGEAGLVILTGQEVRAYAPTGVIEGDFLVFGWRDRFPYPTPARRLIETVHAAGGIVIAAHPFRRLLGAGDLLWDLDVDGAEVFNHNHTAEDERRAEQLCAKKGILRCAGSDAHHVDQLGQYVTVFERDVRSEEDLVRELLAGRFSIERRAPQP